MSRDTRDVAAVSMTEIAIEIAYERLRCDIAPNLTVHDTGERTATGSVAARTLGAGGQPSAVSTL